VSAVKAACASARKTRGAILSVSLRGVFIALGAASTALAHDRRAEPDRHRYPLRGIDVSHYQGTIDWPAVAHDGVAFAYIKATEGVDGRDSQFARNWRDARRAGIRVGAYHYFIFCRSARAQARNFLAVAPRSASALPPAIDLEMARGCARVTGADVRRNLSAYLAIVEAHDRKRAVLYVTPQFFATYRAYLPERPMWRRSISAKPAPNKSWAFWQYGSRGHVTGIRTHVDMNVFRAGGRTLAL
jgi:lysozyme